ncbi:MAG: GNAT family N-acetyltransferase [Planctomycetota bacterium]
MPSDPRISGPESLAFEPAETVLRSLPAWFGVESALLDYARQAETQPTFIAERDGAVVGFATARQHYPQAAELTCLAVRPEHHRQGLGRALVEAAEAWMVEQGAVLAQVKTLSETHPDPHYAQTRAFYTAMGYLPLETLPKLWGPQHPCLVMVKPLAQ